MLCGEKRRSGWATEGFLLRPPSPSPYKGKTSSVWNQTTAMVAGQLQHRQTHFCFYLNSTHIDGFIVLAIYNDSAQES